MKKLVLDLRYNPGGLLNQAIEVAELFLKEGNVIVSTRGRTQKTESVSSKNGMLGAEFPLVVLVNEGSASASEIVAGAIQDWDRGVVIGKTSFGKGSVQTIFPLDNAGHALKLTTAFYYLPMGRCINKPENGIKGLALQQDEADGDDMVAAPDSAVKDSQVYFTAGGRKVYGGGGITPDIVSDQKPMPWIVQAQERMSLFFKFAIKYRPILEKSKIKIDTALVVPDSLYLAFKDFCLKDTSFQKVKTNAQATADIIQEIVLREQKFLGDSSATISDLSVQDGLASLKATLQKNREAQFDASKAYIMDAIKRELLGAVYGEEARIAIMLKSDNQMMEAVKMLKDTKAYQKALSPKADPKPVAPVKAPEKPTPTKKK
jgi:carboxyl-terminal processing protease